MLKFLKDKKKDNKGFTLVELVIVVAILAIFVGILAPQYTKYVEKSRTAADASNLENLVTVVKTAASDSTDTIAAGTYTITLSNNNDVAITDDKGANVKSTLNEVFKEFAGDNWDKARLKSSKWVNDNTATTAAKNTISATIIVNTDGSVTVSYNPKALKETANSNSKALKETANQ